MSATFLGFWAPLSRIYCLFPVYADPLDLPLPPQCGRHLRTNPFAVAEIEGGSDALRENVCRGRVVEPGAREGDVERLIRIGRACTRGLLTYLKFLRYYSISRFLSSDGNQIPCATLARDDRDTTH